MKSKRVKRTKHQGLREHAESVLDDAIRNGYQYAVGNSERLCWIDGYIEAVLRAAPSSPLSLLDQQEGVKRGP